jgi:hypothetical protein
LFYCFLVIFYTTFDPSILRLGVFPNHDRSEPTDGFRGLATRKRRSVFSLSASADRRCNVTTIFITTNQAAIAALFRVVNRYVGNLPPMKGVFPDYLAPVVRNTDHGSELTTMRWGMPPPHQFGEPPVTNIRSTSSPIGEGG